MPLFVDPKTGQSQQGRSGAFTVALEDFNTKKEPASGLSDFAPITFNKGVQTRVAKSQIEADALKGQGFLGGEAPTVNRNVASVLTPDEFAKQQEERAGEIRTTATDDARKRVADIERRFEGIISREETAGEGRLGSTRSRGARAGLLGSSFGAAQKSGTEAFNTKQQQFIQEQQELEINAVFDKFDKQAEARINQERLLSFATREEQIANRDAFIAEGRDNFTKLGESGQFPTLDFLDEEDLAEWSAQTGYSEGMLRLINAENQPQETKIDWQEEVIGNTYLRTGFNPVTGKMETIKIELPVGSDGLQVIDGIPYNKIQNEDGSITLEKAEGFEGKPKDEPTELDVIQQKQEIEKTMKEIEELSKNIEQIGVVDPAEKEERRLKLEDLKLSIAKKVSDMPDSNLAINKKIEKSQSVLDAIKKIEEHEGFNEAVGFNILGGFGKDIEGSAGASYIAQFDNLKGLLTIDNLGIMSGVLSDADIKILTSAATSLSTKMKESEFKKELKNLKDKTVLSLENFKSTNNSDIANTGSTSGGDIVEGTEDLY